MAHTIILDQGLGERTGRTVWSADQDVGVNADRRELSDALYRLLMPAHPLPCFADRREHTIAIVASC
ncbi:MAG: hypothetical protein ABI988_13210 [Nitrospirota bacterium]